jgi:hypothetical protein
MRILQSQRIESFCNLNTSNQSPVNLAMSTHIELETSTPQGQQGSLVQEFFQTPMPPWQENSMCTQTRTYVDHGNAHRPSARIVDVMGYLGRRQVQMLHRQSWGRIVRVKKGKQSTLRRTSAASQTQAEGDNLWAGPYFRGE